MTAVRWLAAWLLGFSSTLTWAGGRVPCSEAQVFGESAVNLVVLPYRYSGDRYGEVRSTASRLSSLLQQEALFSMLRYGSVGATELVAGSAPDACDVRKVIDRVMGPADRPNLRPGHGLVLAWGRIYEDGDEIFVQTYLRFLRRDRSETFEVALPATNAGSLALSAALPAGAVALAPRRLSRSDVEEVENGARMALLLHSAPDPSAASRPLARSPDEPLAYAVTDARDGGWMKIRSFASGETGWIKARVATASWSLRRFMPDLWYLDAVVGYLRLRTSDQVPIPEPVGAAQVKADMFEAVQTGFRRYEETVGRDAAPEAASLARAMRGVLLWTNPAFAGTGDAQVKAALLFDEAREVLPESSGARALAAVTAPFLKPAPVASKSTMASVNDGLLGAIAVDPGNQRALRNLKQVYRFAADMPAASPYESAEVQRRLGVVDSALGAAGPRPIVPVPDVRPPAADPKGSPLVAIKVPDLARLTERQALDFIARAGLNVGRIEPRADAGNVPGTVLGQAPAAGSVATAGSRVDLVVAAAPPRTDVGVVIPELVQLPERRAGEVLRKAGLEVGHVTRRADAKAAPGVVLDQKPASGAKALAGAKVDLLISEPVAITTARVPDVLKRPEREATEILAKANLRLGRVERRTDAESKAGTVLEQSPAAGTQVAAGEKVDLLVAAAPEAAEVRVPDVIKLGEKQAIEALHKAGLDVGRIVQRLEPKAAAAIVLEQAPMPGARAAAGLKVDLWVSAAPSLVEVVVPDLAKMQEKLAVEALHKAGLDIGRVVRRVDTKTAAGVVLVQKPAAAAKVPAGTKVDLLVSASASVSTVVVPNVLKRQEKEAQEMLIKAGLEVGRVERRRDPAVAPGTVLDQKPAGDTKVDAATPVDLVVAAPR